MNKNNDQEKEELPLEERTKICYYCKFFSKGTKCSLTQTEPHFVGETCQNFDKNPRAKKEMWFTVAISVVLAVVFFYLGITDVTLASSSRVDDPGKVMWGYAKIVFGIIFIIRAYNGYKLNMKQSKDVE